MNPKLLIVDDDEEIRTQMKWALAKDYDVSLAEDRASALRAIGAGAYDFLSKPVEMEELKFLLKRCFHVVQLEKEYASMQQLMGGDSFEGMLGSSPQMKPVFDTIRKVATTDAPVLILGESGTGKEMVAKAIHQRSNHKAGPFVAINCSAIPETLLESELFGHEKGAFTGAHVQRKGRIESASGGTLFLDEIGEIPLPLQVKLLRFLQEQTIERVGGRQSIHIDTRVVAATNADLKKSLAAGTFREDLFYRLAVVQMMLPPLRDRGTDVRLLAQFFLSRFAAQGNKPNLAFDQDAIRALNRHTWPGNVRELENCVRRAAIMADGRRVTAADLELNASGVGPNVVTLKDAREAVERQMVQQALIAAAAAELGLSRPTIYELMEKLGISKPA